MSRKKTKAEIKRSLIRILDEGMDREQLQLALDCFTFICWSPESHRALRKAADTLAPLYLPQPPVLTVKPRRKRKKYNQVVL